MEDFKKKIPNASEKLIKAMENIQHTLDERKRVEEKKPSEKVEKERWFSRTDATQPPRDRNDELP